MGGKATKSTADSKAAGPVVLPADCRIAELPALQAQLRDALAAPAGELDGAAVSRVDTAALQLLAAFRRELAAQGRTLRWLGVSDALREAAGLLGLAQTLDLPAAMPA